MALDHHDARRAARRRLETECAGAREQVEATPAFEILAEPVEQRLAHAIGRRPQAVEIEHRERRAFPVTADDADRVRLAAARRAAGRPEERDIRNIDDGGTGRARGAPLNRRTLPRRCALARAPRRTDKMHGFGRRARPRERRTALRCPPCGGPPSSRRQTMFSFFKRFKKTQELIRRNRNRPTRSKRTNRPKRPRSRPRPRPTCRKRPRNRPRRPS